jgi:hypothetical protein
MAVLPDINMALAGRIFHAVGGGAGTGITIPIYSSTSPTFALWNPMGTRRLIVPKTLSIGVAATATPAITSLALGQVVSTGPTYATGLPIAAWTDATVYNGRLQLGTSTNSGRVGVATTTLTTAANSFYELGFNQATVALAAGITKLTHVFNDEIVMDPGTLIHLVGNPIAPVETFVVSITWKEYDLNV